MGEDNGLSDGEISKWLCRNCRRERSRSFVSRGMSLISAATILTPFCRSSLSRADFVARNTAHTATSPLAMKNYLPFVEKERHQSPWMMKRSEDHRSSALHLRLFHVASRQQPRLFEFSPSLCRALASKPD